ncbi:MAG: hydantoinase/oxoprolinase family protein [Planctomycetota bacterium]|nr:hydantoinase/oxoprolinase family protein [Planctomycetota bacterium]
MATRIGIDTGGTFTDVVRVQRGSAKVHKLRSTPADPSRAVLEGLRAARRHDGEEVDLVHGTTVGLNAVLTGSLARTVLVTNTGFEDLIEVGRQHRTDLYALDPSRPIPPIPRRLRVGVPCRRGPGGAVVTALTAAAVDAAVAAVTRRKPEAVAIGLLHAPDDPQDERRLQDALRRALPGVPVTCSAQLLPATGEYERFSAAILNAAIAPVVGRYTSRVAKDMGPGTLRLLRSSLGILPPEEAARFPARAMFSGPAGGVLATRQVAKRFGFPVAAAFDMGGTSADVCLIEERTELSSEGEIAGLPLPLPTVPIHTVAAGGGSIAYADAGGALRVGPQSAGAEPGPACYGQGTEPTVTDAHVALGHLGAETLLDGAFPIDVDASVRAIERLGKRVGMRPRATAAGLLTIADAAMARAILVITAEQAVDPATIPLVAYGGAGGLHAATMTARLGMPHAVIPPVPGAFSALGLARAGEARERADGGPVTLSARAPAALLAHGQRMLAATRRELGGKRCRSRVEALARYRGQGACLCLPLTANLPAAFAHEHERRFGFRTDAPVEVVQLRARSEAAAKPLPATGSARRGAPARHRLSPLGRAKVPVFHRSALPPFIDGPAVVEEATATTLVPEGFRLREQPFGLTLARRT